MSLQRLISTIRTMIELSGTSVIARRYLALNTFDGIMIGLGITLGYYFSGIADYRAALLSSLAIMLATAISGFTGAWISEKTEQEIRLKRIEEAVLHDLKGSLHHAASVAGPLIIAAINSASSVAGIAVVVAPYLISLAGHMAVQHAIIASFFSAMVLLIIVGYLLGRELGKRKAYIIARMVVASMLAASFVLLLEFIITP